MGMLSNLGAAVLSSACVALTGGVDGSWTAFAEKFGITAALLMYFIIRDINNQKRADAERDALVKRIQNLETDQLQIVLTAVKDNTEAMKICQIRNQVK